MHQTNQLRDYQAQDLSEVLRRYAAGQRAAICEWEPGLGKSLLAIEAWNRLGLGRMLVIGPAVSLVSWRQQFQTWAPGVPLLVVASGADIRKLRPEHAAVVVTFDITKNTDVLSTLRDWIEGGFAVVDEAQYLRNPEAQRTAVAYGSQLGVLAKAQNVLLLSGTLIVSWPTDLWTHLARWMPERVSVDGARLTYEQFRSRYHVTQEVPIPGAYRKTRTQIRGMRPDMQDDLRRATAGMSLRRSKADANLPPLTWLPVPLELKPADRKRIDEELMDNLPERLQALARAAKTDPAAAERFTTELGSYTELVSVVLRILGAGKAQAVARIVAERLENEPRSKGIGVFALNHAVLDVIQRDLSGFGVIRVDGSTPNAARERAVGDFQNPAGPQVFAGQISACGTALTLTRADECWFAQQSWTPGENEQAASRFHRIGQTNPVVAYLPYVEGTLDVVVSRVLRKKQEAAALVRQGA